MHLIDAAEASDQAGSLWLSTAIKSLREAACVSDYGLTLDADWSATERQVFITLSESACLRLAARDSIPAQEITDWPAMQGLRISLRGEPEVFTAPVVELGRAIIALISGDLPEPPRGQIWFYGTTAGRQTIGIASRGE